MCVFPDGQPRVCHARAGPNGHGRAVPTLGVATEGQYASLQSCNVVALRFQLRLSLLEKIALHGGFSLAFATEDKRFPANHVSILAHARLRLTERGVFMLHHHQFARQPFVVLLQIGTLVLPPLLFVIVVQFSVCKRSLV